MKYLIAAIALVFVLAAGSRTYSAQDGDGEIRALYERFVTAQNARDLNGVRQVLSDRSDFLWISDGRPFWGREAMIARMASFQEAEVWRVEPEYASFKVVQLDGETAYLHVPLGLVIGRKGDPARLRWLVEVLCQKTHGEWRIAALFTAEDKRSGGMAAK